MSVVSLCLRFGIIGIVTAGAIYAIQKLMEKEEAHTEDNSRRNKPFHAHVPKECSICFEDFNDSEDTGDKRRTFLPKCFHSFHKSCLNGWTRFNSSCPICRTKINKN